MCMQRNNSVRAPRQRGFSLVEVIVVIVVVGIIFSAGAMIMRHGFSAYFGGENITTQDWQSRLAFERMTRDLRDGYRNTDLATSGATGDMAINLSIYDSASATISNVTYARSGNNILQRNGVPLADNVTLLDFALLRSDGTVTLVTSEAFYIQASLTVSTVGGAKGDYNLTFRGTINPRNFP